MGDHAIQAGARHNQAAIRVGHFARAPMHQALAAILIAQLQGVVGFVRGQHVGEEMHVSGPQMIWLSARAARLMSRKIRPSLALDLASTVSTASSPAAVMIT